MTLIISEVSNFGIAMIADSAVTFTGVLPSGTTTHYVLNGARKLQSIPYLNAGISAWGLGRIPISGGIALSTDIWIEDFISRHSGINSLDEFADVLVQELQNSVGNTHALGIHLAGVVDAGGEKVPLLYHVRNADGDYSGYKTHDFIKGETYTGDDYNNGRSYILRNGDYGPYSALVGLADYALDFIEKQMHKTIPHLSLEGRLAYHAAWVRFISDLYTSGEYKRIIGGNVATLGIYPDGHILYQPS